MRTEVVYKWPTLTSSNKLIPLLCGPRRPQQSFYYLGFSAGVEVETFGSYTLEFRIP